MSCEICDALKARKLKILYQDDQSIAFLSDFPATVGHIVVAPIAHFPIVEQIPDDIFAHCGMISNKISTALFESLNIQGTNILVQNGIPAGQKFNHASLNILPRTENDGLELMWNPKSLSEEDMAQIEMKLKEALVKPVMPKAEVVREAPREAKDATPTPEKKSPEEPIKPKAKPVAESEEDSQTAENYMIRQLRRMP